MICLLEEQFLFCGGSLKKLYISLLKMLDELWDEMDGVGCACETLSFVPRPSASFRVLKIEKVTDKISCCASRIDVVRSEMTESPLECSSPMLEKKIYEE